MRAESSDVWASWANDLTTIIWEELTFGDDDWGLLAKIEHRDRAQPLSAKEDMLAATRLTLAMQKCALP